MTRPIADWLREYFPGIEPARGSTPWSGDPCWLAVTMCMSAEHNPPLYWLGRAFDAISEGGAVEVLRARLHAAHGDASCGGDARRDQAVQDVLSEACAYAWVQMHLGPPRFDGIGDEVAPGSGAVQLHVPSVDAAVALARLEPCDSVPEAIDVLAARIETAASTLPAARGRLVYLDIWHERRYAQGVGYRLELTEPLQHAAQHLAQEAGLGHVLTRPFQWGNPIAAHY